jgi:hypothetical protein
VVVGTGTIVPICYAHTERLLAETIDRNALGPKMIEASQGRCEVACPWVG